MLQCWGVGFKTLSPRVIRPRLRFRFLRSLFQPVTSGDLNDVKAEIEKYKVGAPARVGLTAPNDVHVPSGPTGMDPSQTSFFQVWMG